MVNTKLFTSVSYLLLVNATLDARADERLQYEVDECRHLAEVAPDLHLHARVEVTLVDCEIDQLPDDHFHLREREIDSDV